MWSAKSKIIFVLLQKNFLTSISKDVFYLLGTKGVSGRALFVSVAQVRLCD